MAEFRHQNITTPVVTLEDRILRGFIMLTNDLTDAPTAHSYSQLQAITELSNASTSWAPPNETPSPTSTIMLSAPSQNCQYIRLKKRMLNQPKLQHTIPPPANSKGYQLI